MDSFSHLQTSSLLSLFQFHFVDQDINFFSIASSPEKTKLSAKKVIMIGPRDVAPLNFYVLNSCYLIVTKKRA